MNSAAAAVIVFVFVMILIVTEKVHRAVAAVLGAVLITVTGVMDIETAAGYIDFNTVGVLAGMMIFVSVVKRSGMFEYLAVRSAKAAGGRPWSIMVVLTVVTALIPTQETVYDCPSV